MTKTTDAKAAGAALAASSATEWRAMRERGVVFTLPSGLRARLRPVGVVELMRRGRIPDFLTPLAAEAVANRGGILAEGFAEKIGNLAALMEAVCTAAFMEPRVVAVPEEALRENVQLSDLDLKDDEITVYHLSPEDWDAVLTFVTAPVTALAIFRAQEKATLEPVDGGKADPDAA